MSAVLLAVFGGYDGAFLESVRDNPMEQDMIDLWAKQRRRSLPFRFGYVDMNKQAHLMVTRPRATTASH